MANKKKNLEEIMQTLDEIVGKLENETMSLEDSYHCFSEGMNLVMEGNKAIDKVEKQMQVLCQEEENECE